MEMRASVVRRIVDSGEPHAVALLGEVPGFGVDSAVAAAARSALAADPRVQTLLDQLETWPPRPSSGGFDQKDAHWKLSVLADFGLNRSDARVAAVAERILKATGTDGTFLHGGFVHTRTYDTRGYVCVTHVVSEALARFGYGDESPVRGAARAALAAVRLDGGWRPSRQLAIGTKGEAEPSCPFGTQNVLRALVALRNSGVPDLDEAIVHAANNLLVAWQRRSEPYRPVGFGIGSTFMKLAYPFVGYALLKAVDALSAVPEVRMDERLLEMLYAVLAKRDADGMLRAETIAAVWNGWDFGQKKMPSPWITAVAYRAAARMDVPL
jgi:hypothetical protein